MTTLLYIRKDADYENGEDEYESGEYENCENAYITNH